MYHSRTWFVQQLVLIRYVLHWQQINHIKTSTDLLKRKWLLEHHTRVDYIDLTTPQFTTNLKRSLGRPPIQLPLLEQLFAPCSHNTEVMISGRLRLRNRITFCTLENGKDSPIFHSKSLSESINMHLFWCKPAPGTYYFRYPTNSHV